MMIDPSLIDPGERLIWSGKPDAPRYAFRKAWYSFAFGLFFFAFSIFWIVGATNQGGWEFSWFGIPFVIIGACLVLSPLWQIFRATRTTYALTNRRAITDVSGPFPQRTSVPLKQIPFVDVRSSTTGPGHVLFQESVAYQNGGATRRDGFIAIADAAKVGQLLRNAIDKTASAGTGNPS
jgi:hypothetical protein